MKKGGFCGEGPRIAALSFPERVVREKRVGFGAW